MKKPAPVPQKPPAPKVEGPFQDSSLLPARVAAMRDLILQACESGEIERLRPAIERNEVMPLFGRAGARPKNFAGAVEFLRTAAFDGKGLETLALLANVLEAPFAKTTRGSAISWIWPALALLPPAEESEDQRILRLRCTAFADLVRNAPNVAPAVHRVEIGDDGTWHAFGVS